MSPWNSCMWSLYNHVLFSPWQPLRRYFLDIKIQRKKRKVNKKKRRKRKKERKGEREEGKRKLRIQLSDLFFELLSAIVCQCQIGLSVENLTSLPLYWTRKHIPRDPLSSVAWISDCQWKELVGELEGGRGVAEVWADVGFLVALWLEIHSTPVTWDVSRDSAGQPALEPLGTTILLLQEEFSGYLPVLWLEIPRTSTVPFLTIHSSLPIVCTNPNS